MATMHTLFVAFLRLSTAVATTQWRDNGGVVFKLGNISYFANTASSSASLKLAGNWSSHTANVSEPLISNLTYLNKNMLDVLSTVTQYEAVGRPLLSRWAELFDGRFPPIDPARRQFWHTYNETRYSPSAYNTALRQRRAAVDWYSTYLQYPTADSCSESLLIYDIGPGGLPSYREEDLNNNANATFLDQLPKGAKMPGSSICPIFGCVDFVVPIGQVGYWSEVTFKGEFVPVTADLVVRRGRDFVLYNFVEKLAEEGVLKGVGTGRRAFERMIRTLLDLVEVEHPHSP